MKTKTLFMFVMITVASLVFTIAGSAGACSTTGLYDPASYSDAWQPMHDDAFLVELGAKSSDRTLYIYDFGAPENALPILSDGFFAHTNIFFSSVKTTDGSTNWYADTTPGGQALELGATPFFGIYFSDGSDTWGEYDIIDANGAYLLFEANTGMQVITHDMKPVPVPAAVFLLGSGLISLVALRRRR
jgi:hypothetical protein